MPPSQYEVIDARLYRLRHVKPGLGAANTTIVGITNYGGEDLPTTHLPSERDFVQGQWTGRLGDTGEWSITFPNGDASKGLPWRQRFSTLGHLEWIELYRDDVLEFTGLIAKQTLDRGAVTISGYGPAFLLKKAFEADYLALLAPRDAIERYTAVPTVPVADNFPGNSLDGTKWSTTNWLGGAGSQLGGVAVANNAATISTQDSGGGASWERINSGAVIAGGVASRWRYTFTMKPSANFTGTVRTISLLSITGGVGGPSAPSGFSASASVYGGATGPQVMVQLSNGAVGIRSAGAGAVSGTPVLGENRGYTIPAKISPPYNIVLECDGRWVRGYINGVLFGVMPAPTGGGAATADLSVGTSNPATLTSVVYSNVALRAQSPFLLRGSDKGDYVLPGSASTYPTGGLHGRYFNDLDMQADTFRQTRALNPTRTPYTDRLDASLDGAAAAPPVPGAATSNYSVVFFGAVYLKLSAGNYTATVGNLVAGSVASLWIGKADGTSGSALIFQSGTTPNAVTVNAASLGSKDGWYPIIMELVVGGTALATLPSLKFTPPASYTDPGGTALTSGASVVIPATSLSALGCVDERFQGISFFDIVQKTAQAFGHQWTEELAQLESGSFPGQLVPRVRVGTDRDVILEPDDDDRRDPILNYQNELDSTDQAASIRGNGAGLQDGSNGQLQAEVLDVPSLTAGLFDLEAWVDATDISQISLLQARLNSELGLRLTAWQNVTGDPVARDRLADTFPLSGAIAAMRWRPGDGARRRLLDVNVDDKTATQLLQITRQFVPGGRVSTQAGFRQRPKDDAYIQRELVSRALRPQRNYQRQYVNFNSEYNGAGAGAAPAFTPFISMALFPSDVIVKAVCRVAANVNGNTFDIEINGSLVGGSLGGPWITVPADIDITPYATVQTGSFTGLQVRLKNTLGGAANLQFQLLIAVLR